MFTFDGRCLSAAECKASMLYAYAATRRCEYSQPAKNGRFNQEMLGKGVYDCGDRYLDLTRSPRCVRRDACSGAVYEPQRLCLRSEDCGEFGYLDESGTRA